MRRFLEAFFRRPLVFLALMILLTSMGVGIAYFYYPHTYKSTASLWAFRRYEVIGATGPEGDLQSTPAQTQATALSELLQSRSFALLVANEADLAPTLSLSSSVLADPQLLDDALFNEISHNVVAIAQGYNLYAISYINRDPRMAQKVITSAIQQFGLVGMNFSVAEGQRLLLSYQDQLVQAQTDAEKATAVEEQYLANHPNLTKSGIGSINDPKYSQLDAQRIQAQSTVQNLQNTTATINQEVITLGKSAESFFHVLDVPIADSQPVSRSKYYELFGGIGLGVALVGWILYLLISMRRDRAVYVPLDIQKVASVPVVMQLPQLSAGTIPLLLEQALHRSR